MKEPVTTRDVACAYCGAKPGEPCTTPGERVKKVARSDHAARFKALDELRQVYDKWERWHEGVGVHPPGGHA